MLVIKIVWPPSTETVGLVVSLITGMQVEQRWVSNWYPPGTHHSFIYLFIEISVPLIYCLRVPQVVPCFHFRVFVIDHRSIFVLFVKFIHLFPRSILFIGKLFFLKNCLCLLINRHSFHPKLVCSLLPLYRKWTFLVTKLLHMLFLHTVYHRITPLKLVRPKSFDHLLLLQPSDSS